MIYPQRARCLRNPLPHTEACGRENLLHVWSTVLTTPLPNLSTTIPGRGRWGLVSATCPSPLPALTPPPFFFTGSARLKLEELRSKCRERRLCV
jgi:hypothetical protein